MKRVLHFIAWGFGLLAVFIIATNMTFHAVTRPYIYESAADAPSAQVALIPGAAMLANGKPSPIFIDRVDAAIELYKMWKVSKILVSGDNSALNYNEVNPVRTYLLNNGIPAEDIFLDHAGFDTYSTMYRARDIFGVTSVLVTTQSFHLPRAIFIARTLGLQAYGVNTDSGHILFHNYAREIFSDEKAALDLFFHTKPKFLGDAIPITGDGRDYP